MLSTANLHDPQAWSFREACDAVDVRDRDRSVMSDVPKLSGPCGQFSHHHRLLRSRGRDDSPANLVLLLGSGTSGEHWWVHNNPDLATRLGYMLHAGEDPARVPIWRVDAFGMRWGWFLQSVDGQLTPSTPPDDPQHLLPAALAEFDRLVTVHRRTALRHL